MQMPVEKVPEACLIEKLQYLQMQIFNRIHANVAIEERGKGPLLLSVGLTYN
jgi:hypothetical protein